MRKLIWTSALIATAGLNWGCAEPPKPLTPQQQAHQAWWDECTARGIQYQCAVGRRRQNVYSARDNLLDAIDKRAGVSPQLSLHCRNEANKHIRFDREPNRYLDVYMTCLKG